MNWIHPKDYRMRDVKGKAESNGRSKEEIGTEANATTIGWVGGISWKVQHRESETWDRIES